MGFDLSKRRLTVLPVCRPMSIIVLMIEGGKCSEVGVVSQGLSHLKMIKKSIYPNRSPRKRICGMNSKIISRFLLK